MPSTTSVQYRARRNAIMRKGFYEAALLLDADEPLFEPIRAKAAPEPSSPAGSPVSVASFFDERMPEMKPLVLPNAWTVVGKGGKAVKTAKPVYDEPLEKKKKKNKNKKSRKAGKEEEEEEGAAGSALACLAEAPSSSACLRALDIATARANKEAARGLQLKHGKQLKAFKREKIYAREMLCAALAADGALGDDAPPPQGAGLAAQPPKSMRARRPPHVEKLRRSRRLASAAARCFAPGEEEEEVEGAPPPRKTAPSPRSPWLKVEAEPSGSALKRKEWAGASPIASKWAKAASTSRAAKNCAVM